ncbi:MAG: hypothetical protein EHM45_17760 [Desulfobacteraceae bacterium]|nr:MAG: hypothetical protein EHM45_17760 [Desulfobacteraceae bacterium]
MVINEEFNAGFTQAGWKRRKIYYIGLPLWSVLDNHEKIALMAHEVAHKVNGDAARGFLVQTRKSNNPLWTQPTRPRFIASGC